MRDMEKGSSDIIDLAIGTPLAQCLSPKLYNCFYLTGDEVLGAYDYAPPEGLEALRSNLLNLWGSPSLGVENVVLTHGALQGIDLCACTFATASTKVFVTNPTYREALNIFKSRSLAVESVERTNDGELNLEPVSKHIDRGGQAFMYVITHLNNPDGLSLSHKGQQKLAYFSIERGVPVIEDDAYGDAYFDGRKTTTIFGYASASGKSHSCVRVVSLSKRFMPGLRIAFLEAENNVASKLAASKRDFGLSPVLSAITQSIVRQHNEVLATTANIRFHLACGASALVAACKEHGFSVEVPEGGFFLWVKVPFQNTSAFLNHSRASGVVFSAGEPFSPEGTSSYVRLSYGKESTDRLKLGANRLAAAIKTYRP